MHPTTSRVLRLCVYRSGSMTEGPNLARRRHRISGAVLRPSGQRRAQSAVQALVRSIEAILRAQADGFLLSSQHGDVSEWQIIGDPPRRLRQRHRPSVFPFLPSHSSAARTYTPVPKHTRTHVIKMPFMVRERVAARSSRSCSGSWSTC